MKGEQISGKRALIGILACLLVLCALILFGIKKTQYFSDEIYQNIRKSTTENVVTLTSDRAKMLDKTLDLLKAQVQTLAMYLSNADLFLPSDLLSPLDGVDMDVIRIVVFYKDGSAVSSDGAVTKVSLGSKIYQQVFAGKCDSSDTFLGDMGYREVNIYAPIYKGSQIIGGVYLDLDAEALRGAGTSALYESSGYSYLINRDGVILLAPSSFSYAQIYRNVQDVFLASNNSQETVDAFMAALKDGKSGNAILHMSGEIQIICFEPLTEKPEWYYVSVLPIALVESNGQTVIRLSSRMVSMFVLIVIVFLAFLFGILFVMFQDKWKKEINDGRVYKAISENIHTAIFIMDQRTGNIRHTFENMQAVLGIPAKKAQGCQFSREWLEKVGLPAEVTDLVEKAETTCQPVTMELKHDNPSLAKQVWLRISVSPLHLKGRKEYMVAFTDITENKYLMEELRSSMLEAQSASAAKSSFLANMSHDIRTPMNAITGMTAIAVDNIDDKNRVMDCLRKITLSSKHLIGLINDILDMSKIESGKLSLNPDRTPLPELLESLTNIVQIQTKERAQQLVMIVKQVTHETVLCDSVRLSQVLLNILSNAVKFTPNHGRIRFCMEETESPISMDCRRYQFSVKDSGIGMSKEFQSTIFDSFTREKGSRVSKIEGSGLGMSISKWIVDQMQGTIQVISEPGRGSEFLVTIDLPLEAENEEESPLTGLNGISLLLIVDDEELRESTAATLQRLEVCVDPVPDVSSALSRLEEKRQSGQSYDMILLHCTTPEQDPVEAVLELQASDRLGSALLFLSAFDWPELEKQALAAGVNGFLSPPFFRSTLYHGISNLLAHKCDGAKIVPKEKQLKGVRVLLAEDNELNREIALSLLESNGMIVDSAEDGQQCLDRFLASQPGYYRMILTDIQMPVLNGYQSVRKIRASSHPDAKTIPILAVTADAFSEDIDAAKNAGMNGHISKPLDIAQVMSEIKKHL